ncbi:efflux RND transporter periplasmic adaptor subunit [Shewanella cyperi]|uniref:Efflux RND transporter periplasmic adaptor subunit n=1 Tax=Shewanella cyperi TaxID=2814292 RepID=A0A975AKA5_9GAMM|nr:efflux RND transporter periplasmic adaptor subunit [Shewanella cyperi]QSX29955.1 efflux RND transporter periplasmic adaptor subunit [Shewanella cyperi]QSX40731.1 efflux RND transporter periplasmic adaptor subunit [Shewanella cyperi]
MNNNAKLRHPRARQAALLAALAMSVPAFLPWQSLQAATLTETLAPQGKVYACPMHPHVRSHEPGRCPECNMFLVEQVEEEEEEEAVIDAKPDPMEAMAEHQHQASQTEQPKLQPLPQSLSGEATVKYVCPMHSHIISDTPGTCPICGMQLEKVEMQAHQEVQVDVSGSMQQALALRVAPVERQTLWKYVRTVGQIDYDESQLQHIHARVSGWVDKLTIEAVGDRIKRGQLLYELYSPELINAQDDYLLALDTLKSSGNSERYQELVRKAGLRLELLGLNQDQIVQLAKSHKTQYRVPFYAKTDGVVTQLNIREGMYIQPMTEMMALTDLSKVWVIADVFENEQSWLTLGQSAEIDIPALGISELPGAIDYIYPELDPLTRSLRVRIVLDNSASLELRPKTLAKVALFGGPKHDVLALPQEALIQTGKQNRVVVKLSDNSFTAREVTVGMLSQGRAEIISGVSEGELVVTSGQFLLDSEASLKGSLMRLGSGHQH